MSAFLLFFFDDKKLAFKSSLDLYFHPSIIEFSMAEKIPLRLLLMCLEMLEEGFSCERLGRELVEPIVSSKAVPKDLKIKSRSKFNHGFTNCGSLHYYAVIIEGLYC